MSRKILVLILSSILSACGGGGGGSSSNPTSASPTGVIESGDLYPLGVAFTEASLLLARLSADAFLLSESNDFAPVDLTCDNNGSRRIEFVDNDTSNDVTAGDSLTYTATNCLDNQAFAATLNGAIDLDISQIQSSNGNRSIVFDTTFRNFRVSDVDGDITIAGGYFLSLDEDEAVDGDQISIDVDDGSPQISFDDFNFQLLPGSTITQAFDFAQERYTLSFDADLQLTQSGDAFTIDMRTLSSDNAFSGDFSQFPNRGQGRFFVDGIGSECLFAVASDNQNVATQNRPSVGLDTAGADCITDGNRTPGLFWLEFVEGTLFSDPDPLGVRSNNQQAPGGDGTPPRQATQLNLPADGFDIEEDVARGLLYVSMPSLNEIAVVSKATLEVINRIAIQGAPRGIDITSDNSTLLVASSGTGSVALVDLNTNAIETIDVSTALNNVNAHDVVEARAGEIFVVANNNNGHDGFVVRIDRNSGDSAARVASGEIIDADPVLAVDSDGEFLYVGEGNIPASLFKLDLSDSAAPIVTRDRRDIDFVSNLALFPEGNNIALASGQVYRTGDLSQAARLPQGQPAVDSAGEFVFVAEWSHPNAISVFETEFYRRVSSTENTCEANALTQQLRLRADQQVLYILAGRALCEVARTAEGEPNGGAEDIASTSPPRGNADVAARLLNLGVNASAIVEDISRNQIYVSLPDRNEIGVIARDTLQLTDYLPVGPDPQGIDLSADGQTLIVALGEASGIAYLNLNTGAVETVNLADELESIGAADVLEARPNEIFVTTTQAGRGFVAKVDRNSGDSAQRVASGNRLTGRPTLALDAQRNFVYVGAGFQILQLNINDANAPVARGTNVSGRARDPIRLALLADGSRLVNPGGQVFDTSDLSEVGQIGVGAPETDSSGELIFSGRFETNEFGINGLPQINSFDAATLSETDNTSNNCPIVRFGAFQLRSDGAAFYILGSMSNSFGAPTVLCEVPRP